MLGLALALMAAAASSTQKPAQFDLICSGTQHYNLDPPEQVQTEYRIDLASDRYCTGECMNQLPIKVVDENYLIFEQRGQTPADRVSVLHQVDRRTGEWITSHVERGTTLQTKGACQAAAFKGFPKQETKF